MAENKPYFKYWGKADRNDPNRYHLLPYHCLDVAAVGKMLLNSYDLLRCRFSDALNLSGESFTRLCIFFLAIHDIGKFAEVFQNKRPDLRKILYGSDNGRQNPIRHDDLGYVAWKDLWAAFLSEGVFGFNGDHPSEYELEDAFQRLACCAAGHHGHPARSNNGRRERSAKNYFSKSDLETVFDFCQTQWQMHVGSANDILESVVDEENVARFSWWFAGLLVVCDWVGSDDEVFDYHQIPISLEEYWNAIALPGALKALSKSGLFPSKSSGPLSLGELSGENFEPTPLQNLCSMENNFDEPQLWILEDITGAGKTEAAMLLLNRMMAAGQADGFYFGLPTMATADSMYRRMSNCYKRLFDNGQSPSLILAHGSRHLSDDFRKSIIPIATNQPDGGPQDDTGAAQCIAWLADNRKKALLSNVGVGTVDQCLLSILPSRHQGLRLFGLGAKVLLVDEVHAHDAYVNQLLEKLLTFQAYIGGSVILLSATLPHKMKNSLTAAYQKGLGCLESSLEKTNGYPLVTVVKKTGQASMPVKANERSVRSLPVRLINTLEEAFHELKVKSAEAQCACWIRNTVWDASEAFYYLRDEGLVDPEKVILFHARYTLADRLAIEKKVVSAFGKQSSAHDRSGKVLIASQVVENSLDLCFDGMVSDMAPIDALIQRVGRLHRHRRDSSGNLLSGSDAVDRRLPPLFLIHTPDPIDNPGADWYSAFFPKAAYVYPNVGQLWLAARLLQAKGAINMPHDLRELIEGVYGEPFEPVPELLQAASDDAVAEAMGLASLGKYNTLNFQRGYSFGSGQWDEEIHIPTRSGDETHVIYLARSDNERLVPLKEGQFPWDLSSIRISCKKLKDISQAIKEKFQGQLDSLLQTEKRLNKYALVLPVIQVDERRWASEGISGNSDRVDVIYDEDVGLMVGEEIRGD